MAINYTLLFTRLGREVFWINNFLALQPTLDDPATGALANILAQYTARPDLVSGLTAIMEGQANNVAGWEAQLQQFANNTIIDLQLDLNAPSANVQSILPLLVENMVANAQTVQANAISAPIIAPNGGNIGNGVLMVSIQTPAGIDDERIITETVNLVCIGDRFNGANAGGERFSITGFPALASIYTAGIRGNGIGPTVAVANESGQNVVQNGDFNRFNPANTPSQWTITGGVVGVNILSEPTIIHAPTGLALKLLANGVATTIGVSQNILNAVKASSQYAVGVWVRKAGAFGGGSNLQIAVKGTGFTSFNLFNADPSTLTTGYVLYKGFVNLPSVLPTDLSIVISWTGAAAETGVSVYVDDVAIVAPVLFGYVGYALMRGSVDFIRQDEITVDTADDYGGVFQTYFGRFLSTALPSSNAPSISDSLAT